MVRVQHLELYGWLLSCDESQFKVVHQHRGTFVLGDHRRDDTTWAMIRS